MSRYVLSSAVTMLLIAGCHWLPGPDNEREVTAHIAVSSFEGPAPLMVIVSAATSTARDGAPLSYSWDLGGQASANTVTATHTFENPGLYTIRLRVWTEAGAEDTAYVNIRVQGQPPTAVIAADPYAGPAPLTVRFDGTGSFAPDDVIRDHIWDFGDYSRIREAARPPHTYWVAGTYTVTLTVRTAGGVEGQTTAVISVGSVGSASLQFDGNQLATLPLGTTAALSDWTFETWFKAAATGGPIVAADGGALALELVPAMSTIRFQIAGQPHEAALTNLAGSWQHIALVHQADGQATLMVEGIEIFAVPAGPDITVSQLMLGAGFAGKLAEVRFWQEARTRAQIEANRNRRLPSATGRLLGYWRLDEGAGQTLANRGAGAVAGTLGSSAAPEANDPAWSSDGPPLQ